MRVLDGLRALLDQISAAQRARVRSGGAAAEGRVLEALARAALVRPRPLLLAQRRALVLGLELASQQRLGLPIDAGAGSDELLRGHLNVTITHD